MCSYVRGKAGWAQMLQHVCGFKAIPSWVSSHFPLWRRISFVSVASLSVPVSRHTNVWLIPLSLLHILPQKCSDHRYLPPNLDFYMELKSGYQNCLTVTFFCWVVILALLDKALRCKNDKKETLEKIEGRLL